MIFPVTTGSTTGNAVTPPAASGLALKALDLAGVRADVARTVRLSAGALFSGTVRDPYGVAVSNTRVSPGSDPASGSTLAVVTSGAGGAFSFRAEPSDYRLMVERAGASGAATPSEYWFAYSTMTLAANLTQDIRVPTVSVDVATVGPAGDAVAGSVVTATGSHGDGSLSLIPGTGTDTAPSARR